MYVDERGVVRCGCPGCRGVVGELAVGFIRVEHAGRPLEVERGRISCNAKDHHLHDVAAFLSAVALPPLGVLSAN